uniref:Uncharacterized protein n=1 Tax=Lepeophtheirus salmonis TaxID=72036 RepID=A0A0K2U4U7_LEPSM
MTLGLVIHRKRHCLMRVRKTKTKPKDLPSYLCWNFLFPARNLEIYAFKNESAYLCNYLYIAR